jgi:hypothetical protein
VFCCHRAASSRRRLGMMLRKDESVGGSPLRRGDPNRHAGYNPAGPAEGSGIESTSRYNGHIRRRRSRAMGSRGVAGRVCYGTCNRRICTGSMGQSPSPLLAKLPGLLNAEPACGAASVNCRAWHLRTVGRGPWPSAIVQSAQRRAAAAGEGLTFPDRIRGRRTVLW